MALAEARAVWQRTANRCFVQEDAKRAPKLACCSSVSPVKQADTGVACAAGGQHIPSTVSVPFNLNPSYSNLSPNSKWWLQQPHYGYQKNWIDEQFDSVEEHMETGQMHENSEALVLNQDDRGLIDEMKCRNLITGDKKDVGEPKVEGLVGCDVSKNANEPYFDSNSVEKNMPWWRTADTDELALLVAQRSLDRIENCDLPSPQNSKVKKDVDVNTCCLGRDGVSGSFQDRKLDAGSRHNFSSHLLAPDSMSAEGPLWSSTERPLRDIPTHERTPETHTFNNNSSKAQLMEALRHSQTRAREAERAANRACAEKELAIKLVFRQATQLFAYKQLLQLLQLENMYLQLINNKNHSVSVVFPVMIPWTPQRTRKVRKRDKQPCPLFDVSKYAAVLALGLGLVGAGFLLGWTVGWMLPTL